MKDSIQAAKHALDEKDFATASMKVRAALASVPNRGLGCAAIARTLACDRRASSSLMGVVFASCRLPTPKQSLLEHFGALEQSLANDSVHVDQFVLREIRSMVEGAKSDALDVTAARAALDELFRELRRRHAEAPVTLTDWRDIKCWFCPRVPYCECICACGKEVCAPKCGK